uniref:Fibronectin type-III domain-containing protein n=1 Tax=Neogobius melanostomus TaxID=47308 RepID=A0A8C6WTF1_9GOBI
MLFAHVMGRLKTLWLLSIMMAGWCFSYKGPPVRPSPPDCHIPCDGSNCSPDIICTWDPMPGLNNNLTYTLHWEGSQSNATGHRAVIQRHEFTSQSVLQIWVQAKDQDGTVSRSEPFTFDTARIIKPSPPKIMKSHHEPMEIHWTAPCDQLMLELEHCDVRFRAEAQPEWIKQEEGGVSVSYTLDSPEPCTNYLFQVHCACITSLMSEWSEVYTIKSAERDPIGTLDVWRDCGMLPQKSECVLTWKKLPMTKACGHILGYNLRLDFDNGTQAAFNESVESSMLVCSQVQCYYNSSLKNVKSVRIDAYNAIGVSQPSHLEVQVQGKIPKEEDIFLEMNENNLTVSWKITTSIPDIKEYVVQYKEAGSSLGQGLDWIRLNSSVTKVTIKGKFKKFTAYQVSVFTVLEHNKVQFYCTDVTHFVQGKPAKVPLFKVLSCDTTHVTLLWETVMMSVQNGVTPYYQVGYGKDNVKNVSAHPQLETRTITLDNLKENQTYEVWINAVNQAGPGPNITVLFTTLSNENIGAVKKIITGIFGGFGLVILLCVLFCCWDNKACSAVLPLLYEKVPDPHNSNIIKEMKTQINDSLAWIRKPEVEKILLSEIEIIKTSSFAFIPQTDKIINEDGDDPLKDVLMEEHKNTHCGCGKQEYSKMVDSDEDKNDEDETGQSSWSSEEDNAGYEQHFMPTDLDLQEIEERERTEKRCAVFCQL